MFYKNLSDKKSPYLFFIKFLFFFFLLYFFFPFYRGVTAPGGILYSPFLAEHFNIIEVFTRFLTNSSKLILENLRYKVFQPDYHTLRLGRSGGVNVNPSCLGWAVMSFWVAFIFANKGDWKHKLIWMITGIISICTINIIRISLVTISLHLHWKNFASLDHHQTFNLFSYGCIFILMYWYIRVQKKYEEIRHKPNHTDTVHPI